MKTKMMNPTPGYVPIEEELVIDCSSVSRQALGSFISHPQLKTICIQCLTDTFPERTNMANMIKQIIETCPKLHRVQVSNCDFTFQNFKPILDAFYYIKPRVVLELMQGSWNQQATYLLQIFLHKSPYPVQLSLDIDRVKFNSASIHPSWLTDLIGPSVIELNIDCGSSQFMLGRASSFEAAELHYFMWTIGRDKNQQSLKKLAFINVSFENYFLYLLDGIPDLLLIETISIDLPSDSQFDFSDPRFFARKRHFLDALTKNTNITKVDFQITGRNLASHPWNHYELERLSLLGQRNKEIASLMTLPDSIPLGAWPYVFQSIQKTRAASSLIFQGLRGLADRVQY